MVGTVFINAAANVLAAAVRGLRVSVSPPGVPTQAVQVEVGSVNRGQRRSVVLPSACVAEGQVTAASAGGAEVAVSVQRLAPAMPGTPEWSACISDVLRGEMVDLLRTGVNDPEAALDGVQDLALRMHSAPLSGSPAAHVAAMRQDLVGQVAQALSPTYHRRWGRNYLLSLAAAHQEEVCNNFKDHGVQNYGGPEFSRLQALAEEMFDTVPPPAARPPPNSSAAQRHNHVPRLVNMRTYNTAAGGCFSPDSRVLRPDGSTTPVDALQRGDQLCTLGFDGEGNRCRGVGTVECLVRHQTATPPQLVDLRRVRLTPTHPVLGHEGKCVVPTDLAPAEPAPDVSHVCNLLIAERPPFVLFADGSGSTAAVTPLAHHLEDDLVARHDFLGTERVAEELRQCTGFGRGLVTLPPAALLRDVATGWCKGIDVAAVNRE